jgi:FKBP-type peptidyl-prolyl cis-trans isomerase FklB
MKIKFICITILLIIAFNIHPAIKKNVKLKNQKDKISYSLGYDIGSHFIKDNGIDINLDIFIMAIKAGVNNENPVMTKEEMEGAIRELQQQLAKKQQEEINASNEKNKIEGELFLTENKKAEGVIALESGLQYKIIKEGEGKTPKPTDTITVNYRGTLIDGKEFDSSYSRNEPATFVLNQVIKGWIEGLQYIKEGGKIILYIPSELAYGGKGAGEVILPNSTLIFEIELIKVE